MRLVSSIKGTLLLAFRLMQATAVVLSNLSRMWVPFSLAQNVINMKKAAKSSL